jgi:hypothetical protein
VIIVIGSSAYRYFGAGEDMAIMDESGSLTPALITGLITIVFCLFGLYGLSAANKFRRLPFLKIVLIVIAAIFILRGLGLFGDLYMMQATSTHPPQMIYFSIVALITGAFYAIGTAKKWHSL